MKRSIRTARRSFCAAFFICSAIITSVEARTVQSINAQWKFTKGDVAGAQAAAFDDAAWTSVGIPHSASIPYWATPHRYVGWAWYRKHFTLDAQYNSRKIFIDFEAVFQHAWVYVNGTLVGEHKGGYTGFSFDISPYVKFGSDNVLAVRLNNNWDARIAPRAGGYNFHAGIYRDVSIIITDPLHVTRFGTFVTTPNASAASSGVNIKTEIRNDAAAAITCTLNSTVCDSTGKSVVTVSSSSAIPAGQSVTVSQNTAIANPNLWSPSRPYLYSILTEVYNGSTLVDSYVTPFGVRWYTISATNGFFLNGQHLYLRGFNVHQDHAGWADGVTNAGFYRDMNLLKKCGTNCIRASHYPKDPAWYEACDRLGILVFAELHLWGRGGFADGKDGDWGAEAYPVVDADRTEFEANLTANLRDMVREARNHPSIFAYSLGNETDMQMNGTTLENCKTFWKKLNVVAHQEDSTRFTSCGWVFFTLAGNATQQKEFIDLAGCNGGTPDAQWPIPVITTEYGSCIADRPGSYEPIPVITTEYGSCIADRPGSYEGCGEPSAAAWRCGALRWSAFHYGIIYDSIQNTRFSSMGMIDYNRLPLRQYYWYANQWLGLAPPVWPVAGTAAKLVITADKTTIKNDGTDDCQIVITVQDAAGKAIANNVNATLKITSGPGILPTGTSWDFATPDGKQAIEMRSYGVGQITATATSAGLQPGTISIMAINNQVVGTLRNGMRSVNASPPSVNATVEKRGSLFTLTYSLPAPSFCAISLCNLHGQTLRMLVNGDRQPGRYSQSWDENDNSGKPLPGGVYILSLLTNTMNKRFVLQIAR